MADKENKKKEKKQEPEEAPAETKPAEAAPAEADPLAQLQEKLNSEHDAMLRMAAEYDNFRKRTQKEKDASYANGMADTLAKLLPVYDNLERALNQPTEDAAYKKGVEMTMTEMLKIFRSMGLEPYGEPGSQFDPQLHNAVMHTQDENLGENVIAQIFQKGFRLGEKVVRFAMVQVAN